MAKATASQYLKLVDTNGNIVQGECYDAEHMNEISLTGWDWGVVDPAAVPKDPVKATAATAAAAKPAKPEGDTDNNIKPAWLSIAKQTDRSTVRLLQAVDNGEVFPSATLVIEEEFEAAPLPFLMKVELTDVFLVDFGWNASAGNAGLEFTETWKLNYSNIKFSYLWRGSPPGWLHVDFDRPPNLDEGTNQKVPPSANEKKAEAQRLADEAARRAKSGK
jgi:type VI protein secretion system component Hcp